MKLRFAFRVFITHRIGDLESECGIVSGLSNITHRIGDLENHL